MPYTDADLCPECGHPGYDGHDMRTAGYPCLTCACGHEDDRDWRLDRWIEATLGARLYFLAAHWLDRSPLDLYGDSYWPPVYRRWAQLYHRGGAAM